MSAHTYHEAQKTVRDALRALKAHGRSAESVWREYRATILDQSKKAGWKNSETAMALATLYANAEKVYGKRKMREADDRVKAVPVEIQ